MRKNSRLGLVAVSGLTIFAVAILGAGCDDTIEAVPAPAATDGATSEASTPDGATPTGDGGDGGTTVCKPGDITGFAPTWIEPVGLYQNKCTLQQIGLLATCVWDDPARDQGACDAFFAAPANAACVACGYTKTTEPKLGAIVSNNTSVQANYPGCIALVTGDVTSNGCGAKVQAKELCLDKACVANCPVPDGNQAAFDAFKKCQDDAAAGACATYANAAKCADPFLAPGGTATVCAPVVANFGDRVEHYLKLFCGSSADGGTDGG